MQMNETEAHTQLMRRAEAARTTGCDESGDLAPARGIVSALALSLLIWILVAGVVFFLS
jgi:hypothetical protein